ncbi:hypothetical protein ACRALDRAFT_211061 [Sodiomyces alcalophilus JCM 7366]|uniref:uncharacterized protein n=1 Tax=Sodiomyces alcalophilus JCM 7366 TaxID=591952 RepID=UPI0039B48B6B
MIKQSRLVAPYHSSLSSISDRKIDNRTKFWAFDYKCSAMAPGSSSSSTPTPSSLHHAIRQRSVIPRRLFRIPADQRALLDRPDSWFNPSANTTKPLFNVPPGVLDDVKARILPPPAQKPLSSSASTQAASPKKRKAGHDEARNRPPSPSSSSESSEGIPMSSWSLSPPRPMPVTPGFQKPLDDSDDSESPLSQALPGSRQSRTNTNTEGQSSQGVADRGHNANWQSDIILSQSPLPEPKDALRDLTSPSPRVNSSAFASVTQTQSQADTRLPPTLLQRTLGPLLPPSSSGIDELEAEIPGALFRATPPINRTSVLKGNFANTPPCGQGSVVPSTYTATHSPPVQGQPRRRRPMKRIKFDDSPSSVIPNTVKQTPGQGISRKPRPSPDLTMSSSPFPISATFPNNRAEPAPSDKPNAASAIAEACEETLPEQPQHDGHYTQTRSDVPELLKSPSEAQRNGETEMVGMETQMETVEMETVEMETVEAEIVEAETVEAETVEAETVEAETPKKGPTLLQPNWAEFFWKEPLEAYQSAYDSFRGSLGDFVRACLSIKSLRRERKLPVFLYDDFIRVFCDDYIRYIERTDDDPPLYAMEWYVENIPWPLYLKGIVTNDNLGRVFEVHATEYYEARKALGFSRSPTVDKSFTVTREESPKTAKALAPPSERAATRTSTPLAGRDTAQPASRPGRSTEPLQERPQAPHTEEQSAVQATHAPKTVEDATPVTINLVDADSSSSEADMETRSIQDGSDSATVANGDGHQGNDGAAATAETPDRPIEQQPPPDTVDRPVAAQDGRHQSKARHSMPGRSEHTQTPNKVKPRVLPPSFAPSTPNGTSQARRATLPAAGAAPPDKPSPAPSARKTATPEGGVRKNKKKESRQEKFRRHLQKLKEEGRLPGQASSSAPPRHSGIAVALNRFTTFRLEINHILCIWGFSWKCAAGEYNSCPLFLVRGGEKVNKVWLTTNAPKKRRNENLAPGRDSVLSISSMSFHSVRSFACFPVPHLSSTTSQKVGEEMSPMFSFHQISV